MRASFRDPYCGPETVDHHTGEPGGGRAPCDDGHMVVMSDEEFEAAVDDALEAVPGELLDMLDNVVILIEDEPEGDDPELLGLYDGIALTDRGDTGFGELPDRILIFKNPTLRVCEDADHVREEVAITVVHEIAHHFGIDDERLHRLGWS